MLARAILKLLSSPLFWVTHRAFRSKLLNRSARKHRWMMSCFRLAADSGHRQALSVYGHLLCLRGDSTKSKIQGAIYLERAAEMGDSKACFQMGRVYEQGFEDYFATDPSKAIDYYLRAAAQGHGVAINRLADAYQNGELELLIDADAARYWRGQLPG